MEKECKTKEKYWKYQVNNKFEKIFIKSCKKMKKGKVREDHRTNIKKQSPMRAGGSKTGKLQEEGGMCAGP